MLGEIRNPVLVMAGALDQTTPPTLARELAEKIPGAKFMLIPGCGHCPQIEKPDAFVEAVNTFLPPWGASESEQVILAEAGIQ